MAEKKKNKAAQGAEAAAEEAVNEAAGKAAEVANEEKAAEAAETAETAETAEAEKQPEAADETAALKAQLAEANDRLMRTLAEYDNFRKRSQKEKEALYKDVKAETVQKLLPVIDNLERAAAAGGDLESYKKGVEMTLKQTADVFASLGVECFGEKGEGFDPNLHNGVMHEDNAELPENSVADVFQKGYKLGDKVIRHATVKVAN
jgi:molecular chaperone GrpE